MTRWSKRRRLFAALRRSPLLIAVLAAQTGCALAPPPSSESLQEQALPTTPLPPQWTAGEPVAGVVEDDWLSTFADPQLEALVAEAIEQARVLNATQIGTEHLLLALLKETGSVAYNALKALGCTFDAIHQDVLKQTAA